MEYHIRLLGRQWIGPYTTADQADDDAKLMGFTRWETVKAERVSVVPATRITKA